MRDEEYAEQKRLGQIAVSCAGALVIGVCVAAAMLAAGVTGASVAMWSLIVLCCAWVALRRWYCRRGLWLYVCESVMIFITGATCIHAAANGEWVQQHWFVMILMVAMGWLYYWLRLAARDWVSG